MRVVNSLTTKAAGAIRTGNIPAMIEPLGTVDDATAEVVERLFRQLQAIFPAHKQAWPDDKALAAARRSWTKGFIVAGICTLEHIRFG
ncbi:replication protein P, partial [Pseudomonas sp. Y24-6]|uniref:replication protein P n=1 Tax=Pseudomonas sp. Y24-6 TaxID=2750013 RepID=UPI0021F09D8C